jgi:hypothetical protein
VLVAANLPPQEKPVPKKTQPTESAAPIADAGATTTVGSQEQYERFLPQAQKLPAVEVRPMRADVSLAIANAARGIEAVLAKADEIRAGLPKISIPEIEAVRDLGSAVAYAAGQVERFAPPPSDLKDLLARAQKLRALLLGSADVLAVAGILPAAQVKKIHEGHGAIDSAGDCGALAALFQKNAAAVRGKVAFTNADVQAAADVGSRLLAVLRPRSAGKKPAAKDLAAASEARDRLWTLFERNWEGFVWRAGAWIHGRAVDDHVPPLQSRVVGKRAPKVPPAPSVA